MSKVDTRKVNFLNENCTVIYNQYDCNGRTAIELICEDGEPMAVATVNIVDENIMDNEVIIKNYSENNGILDALINSGIISKPVSTVNVGFEKGYVCKFTPYYKVLEV